jgi:hypothetical protein
MFRGCIQALHAVVVVVVVVVVVAAAAAVAAAAVAAAAVAAAADPIAVDDTAAALQAAALQRLLCCQVSHMLAGRSSACCSCRCGVRVATAGQGGRQRIQQRDTVQNTVNVWSDRASAIFGV